MKIEQINPLDESYSDINKESSTQSNRLSIESKNDIRNENEDRKTMNKTRISNIPDPDLALVFSCISLSSLYTNTFQSNYQLHSDLNIHTKSSLTDFSLNGFFPWNIRLSEILFVFLVYTH